MCNALAPSCASIGTRSRNAMSSSILMQSAASPRSRHQFIAAGFGDQNPGGGGVLFDLLPQPINMRFQSVGGDPGIIAPHFLQQRLTRDRPLTGAIEIAQYRGFLL